MAITFYEKRLTNEIEVTQELTDIYWGIIESEEIDFEFDNADGLFSDLLTAGEEFRNKGIKCRINEPLEDPPISFLIYGKIIDFDITSIATFTIAIGQHPELDVDIPKKVYETTDWTESLPTIKNPPQDLGKPYPLIFGYCKKVPLINVHWDSFNNYFDFILCVTGWRDNLHHIPNVIESNDSNKATTVNIYRNKILVGASEYTVYDGSQSSPYPGYAFIRFIKEQIDFSGSYYELTADIRGLKLGSDITATRNFVRVIEYLLSNLTWGLGLSINAASFDTAAASMTEYLCDGFLAEQQNALDVINELLFCCRGKLDYNESGEIAISVENYNPKVQCVFGHKDGKYENIISIDENKKTAVDDALKSFTLNYGYNQWEGEYTYKNKRSIFSFGEDKTMDMQFIRDHVTADKITSYKKQLMIYGDSKLSIQVGMEARQRLEGDVTRIISPDYNIDQSYQIRKIKKTLNQFTLDLYGYDAAIYQYIPGTMPSDAGDDALPDYSNTAPSPPTTFQKTSQGTSQSTDGTTSAYFLLSAVAPVSSNVVTKVKFGYMKVGESAYTYVDGNKPVSGNIWTGRIDGLVPGVYYNLVAVSENAFGMSSLGNPTLLNQLAPGDTTAPAQVTGLSAAQGVGLITLTWTKNTASDMDHYDVYRGGVYLARADTTKFVDSNLSYGVSYSYYVRAVDHTGNAGIASSSVSQTCRQTITTDVQDNAITMPVNTYTSASIALLENWTAVQQTTINSSGGTIHITCSAIISLTSGITGNIGVRVTRDGLSKVEEKFFSTGDFFTMPYSITILDTPSAGSHTYYLEMLVSVGSNGIVGRRSITLLEIKK